MASYKSRLILFVLLLFITSATRLLGQEKLGYLVLNSSCNGSFNQITLGGEDIGGHEPLVAYDIYRTRIGDCSAAQRITTTPIPRRSGAVFVEELVDEAVEENTMYFYKVVGVDQNRETVSLWPAFFAINTTVQAYASCGLAPVAFGFLEDGGWNYTFEPCEGTCYKVGADWIDIAASNPAVDLASLVGTGQSVMLFGSVFCGTVEGCFIAVEAAGVHDCTVSVKEGPWSRVKGLYR